ncbi:hypothetical protein [Listeria rustica]|uniref:Uncharacterized protein n=1 Tax=Listeria rustica TaxID=2713503 RepID=A0A7W1T7H0_9LIST|nr:hypothetical protein [Listeria rustica]MBA3926815.1 hypothetical protein [Listeria rustica]
MTDKNILLIVEGAKQEPRLIEFIFNKLFPATAHYQIYSFKTNLYSLYNHLKKHYADKTGEIDLDSIDLLGVLKEYSKASSEKEVLSKKYTDILLVFDFDPHDSEYNKSILTNFQSKFGESTEDGQLFINYPMVESFKHFKSLPDHEYSNRDIDLATLSSGKYKSLVDNETFQTDLRKYSSEDYLQIIRHNIMKIDYLLNTDLTSKTHAGESSLIYSKLLDYEINYLEQADKIHILNTSILFALEYNPNLLH